MEQTNIGRIIGFMLLFTPSAILAQGKEDSIETRRLEELIIRGQKEVNVERLPDISGTRVWSGKKNEVLNITNLDANVAEKTARQVFAKVPGVFVYDMGGTGNQINIATRGLDPHRRWSLTSAERCHYKLRYVRISGQSLQYAHGSRRANSVGAGNRLVAIRGAVGGMLNYITKSATPPDE